MKSIYTVLIMLVLTGCDNKFRGVYLKVQPLNYLHSITTFTTDSLVNAVIEIPAGTTQKWEVNKETGKLELEQISRDSFRVIDYLPYPANYGFIPQTLLPEGSGGDGDPLDVFILGPLLARGKIVNVRIVGMIKMLDNNETDDKLLAVPTDQSGLKTKSYEMLITRYPAAVEILKLWLMHYKGSGKINILSVNDEKDAMNQLKESHSHYIAQKNKK